MYQKTDKRKIWKLAGMFFAGMILFTLLSRAAYQHGTAVVTTTSPTKGIITHTVQITGKIVQNQDLAVTTVSGLRVSSILVNEGQQVSQGDVLLKLDLEYLEEAILNQKLEMEKQSLSIQDAWSQNSAAQQQRANAKAQAEENYDSAVFQAETTLIRAEQDLAQAEQDLEDYYNGVVWDQNQEAELTSACQKAEADYNTANDQLDSLQQELEDKIAEAIAQAEADLAAEQETQESGEVPPSQGLTQQERDEIAQRIRDEYASRLDDAQLAAEQALQAWDQAKEALEAYQQQEDAPARSEEELLAALESAQENYDDALYALENAETVYGRAIASANLPEASNHSPQIGQITYDQMALELEKLEALWEAGGEITAPVDGIVTQCYVQTGGKTTDTTAVLLADLSQGSKFSGLASQEQSEYIGVGDPVDIQPAGTEKVYEDLPVTSLSATEETGGGYRLTVQLPANVLTLGTVAELTFTRNSEAYLCCVPLSALRLDEQNKPYVLVAEPVNTVLGTQTQARKVTVTVLDQNEQSAALAPGAVSTQQQVIVQSDRSIEAGSRVRVD